MENLAEEQQTPVEQQKKLFIGGLNPTTTDDQLKEYCSKFGEIIECSIIRDKTGRSRSFAFVCFQELSSVDEFMKQRPHMIDGRKSEVRRAMPRSETSKFETVSTVNKIFVGAIPTDLTEDELRSHFQTFGNVVECHIMKDKEEKSRGFGFVTYDDYDAVDRCILEKPHLIHGKKVDVQKAIPRDQCQRTRHSLPRAANFRPVDYTLTTQPLIFNYPNIQGQYASEFSKPIPLMNSNNPMNPSANFISNFNYYPPQGFYMAPIEPISSNRIPRIHRTPNKPRNSTSSGSSSSNAEHNRKLFIGGLSAKTTDETLKDYVIKFGELSDCLVMKDQNGHSKCFGFVTFTNSDSLDEFMKNRPHLIDGRQVDPKRAMPREEAQNNDIHLTVKKIFLGGLRDGLNEETLRNYFQQFGNITDCLMMQDHEGNLRGFAFIEFDDYDSVDKVILARPHTIGEHKIDVKKAIPKENRSQTYQNHLNGFDLASNNCYYPFNPLFPSGFYSPSVPLLTPYGASHLNENFSHLHLSNISTSNIRGQAPRNSQ